jgi:response regulator of citrate/malate metabolism/nitrogen-specific signal transduction histidine kinase
MSHSSLQSVLEKGIPELDEERDINGVRILTNSIPIKVNEKIVGAIATFRDKTEIEQLAEELTGVRLYADALRAQTHEFMNKLHVILGMVQLGLYDRLSDYIERIANQQQTESESITSQIKHPVLAGFILAKISHAREEGVDLLLATDSYSPDPQNEEMIHDLITILGSLIANALDALDERFDKRIFVSITYQELEELLVLQVRDTGLGFREEKIKEIFIKGYSTKGENRGIGLYLIQRNVEKWNGKIELLSSASNRSYFTRHLYARNKRVGIVDTNPRNGQNVDVIVISAARDVASIKKALQYGAVDYLIKPFEFDRFKSALSGYRESVKLTKSQQQVSQDELDRIILHKEHPTEHTGLPKGLTKTTLKQVWENILDFQDKAFSTDELACRIGISRVSLRKYLNFLNEIGFLDVEVNCGSIGRPVYQHKLILSKIHLIKSYLTG